MAKNNKKQSQDYDLLTDFKEKILNIDPVQFCENNLTLDGQPFRLTGNGYAPFRSIYRYIALNAINKDAKPVILVKGRQVGATSMAAALTAYFMACGLFGNNNRSPMRLIHLFPTLAMAAAYTKDKLDPVVSTSKPVPGLLKSNGLLKSFLESKFDTNSPANNSMHFKKFHGGNQIWIESTGPDGDRVRGRQLALDTELPTPTGFIRLRDLKEGDQLFDENGDICNVTKLHPVNLSPESYKITFDDGTVVEACAEHLWQTYTKRERNKRRQPGIRNTKEILQTLKVHGESNHSIPLCKPVKYEHKNLPIDPYLLGFWLGDGGRYGGLETMDADVVLKDYDYRVVPSSIGHMGSFSSEPSKSCSYRVSGLTTSLKNLGLVDNPGKTRRDKGYFGFYIKNIPHEYMHASVEQRLALLQGLMDSDGSCTDGRCEFSQAEPRKGLVYQVYDLLCSLGIKVPPIKKKKRFRYDVQYKDAYVLQFYTTLPIFKIKRKISNIKEKLVIAKNRYIRKIEPIDPKPMRCITVDSPSHLYLITRAFIPTHNTVDGAFFDECFPYDQHVQTIEGEYQIGKLCEIFLAGKEPPLVKTYNEFDDKFEYKKITNAWNRGPRELVYVNNIRVTANHKFLTQNGWLPAEILFGQKIKTVNGFRDVERLQALKYKEQVYDIEVEDNHNFVLGSGEVAHNCQDMHRIAIGAVTKILAQAKYGFIGKGLQVYFGTPKQRNSLYYEMWKLSTQQYYHLHCESCCEYFPLYRPDVNWEDIWLYGFVVKCTNCGHEQDKNEAAERGKWIPLNESSKTEFVGYHINQLYIPTFAKETILSQKPERNPANTERIYMNEVLGEFYDGEGGTITADQIQDFCGDMDRKFRGRIDPSEGIRSYAGFDWGQRGDWDQLAGKQRGQSYSCAVIITAQGPKLFNIEFATRLDTTAPEDKEQVVDELFRRYNVHLGVGDIGDAYDLTHRLQRKYNEKFLASRAIPKVSSHIKFDRDIFPKEIKFERDYYISELIGLLKDGSVRFPYKSYERIRWLVDHCSSMEIKVTMNRSGDPVRRFVKGASPNDGFMALLNAYLAWKFDVTQGFKIQQPQWMKTDLPLKKRRIPAVVGRVSKFH